MIKMRVERHSAVAVLVAVMLTVLAGNAGAADGHLWGGRHRYRLSGCPAGAGKETLSVTYNCI